ncbi:DUF4291 domain-containing protein [Roseomonas rosulenta]|uniref:DUF4291 domain-containing protein n=1 Tax=Roseomonas rosulenta TaxID=2748667 RepID=UPI0018DF5FD0|nr:DUF4291 domain-containing protein [Roseomonas rosulenta]
MAFTAAAADPVKYQVRADFTATEVALWQAYAPAIAEPALSAQRFVPPFRRTRMTWVKPSFLWMMYRSGWATKPQQDRVLRIVVSRAGFDWMLEQAVPTRHVDGMYASAEAWRMASRSAPVLVQWDPERDLGLRPSVIRTIQLGLRGVALDRYVDEWTLRIEDATPLAHRIAALVARGDTEAAQALLPREAPYPAPPSPGLELSGIAL